MDRQPLFSPSSWDVSKSGGHTRCRIYISFIHWGEAQFSFQFHYGFPTSIGFFGTLRERPGPVSRCCSQSYFRFNLHAIYLTLLCFLLCFWNHVIVIMTQIEVASYLFIKWCWYWKQRYLRRKEELDKPQMWWLVVRWQTIEPMNGSIWMRRYETSNFHFACRDIHLSLFVIGHVMKVELAFVLLHGVLDNIYF